MPAVSVSAVAVAPRLRQVVVELAQDVLAELRAVVGAAADVGDGGDLLSRDFSGLTRGCQRQRVAAEEVFGPAHANNVRPDAAECDAHVFDHLAAVSLHPDRSSESADV